MEDRNTIETRAARTQPINKHLLVDTKYVKQHFMGNRRIAKDLHEEYDAMTNMLFKRARCTNENYRIYKQNLEEQNRELQRQTISGRKKLKNIKYATDCQKELRNYLINHKEGQRLYSNMPLPLALENINHHTFGLRKERDRLRYRMEQMKEKLKSKLIEKSELENRHVYKSDFVLEEERRWHECLKKIENSKIRLRGIKAINVLYKKMIQVLQHDSDFYEPILECLKKDIGDQEAFLNYVLYVGKPAIALFKKLSEEHRQREEKSRKQTAKMLQLLAEDAAKMRARKRASYIYTHSTAPYTTEVFKRFLRETPSMQALKEELNSVEDTMKQLQNQVLCSKVEDIFNRMKTKSEIKKNLEKDVVNEFLAIGCAESKMNRAEVLKDVLINNLYSDEIRRLKHIEFLKQSIKEQDDFEDRMTRYLKDRANVYVLLRFSLWRMSEIVQGVGPFVFRPAQIHYPTEDLTLPLLKFELFQSNAYPPQGFEENVHAIMKSLKGKIKLLNKSLKTLNSKPRNKNQVKSFTEQYHNMFLNSSEYGILTQEKPNSVDDSVEDDVLLQSDLKPSVYVPTRTELKVQSYKLIDAMQKKDT